MVNPLVSIIIPIRHGEDISQVLDSIHNSTYKHTEIIVVDEGKERSEQRNLGIERAKGKYLMFLDSDQEINPLCIEECVRLIYTCYGIYIPEIIMTQGWFGRLRNFERQFYTATAVDCVRFVRAKNCPKFDTELNGPEDASWDRMIIGNRRIAEQGYLLHYDNIGIIKYVQKKAYYAKSMSKYAKKHPYDPCLNLKYRCWTVFIERGKWKVVIRHPIKMIGIFMILAIRGIIYLCLK